MRVVSRLLFTVSNIVKSTLRVILGFVPGVNLAKTIKRSPNATVAGRSYRIAIIGAGPSGITAAKNVLEAKQKQGLNATLTVFEQTDQLGGNWVYRESVQHSSIYETTHIISSRYLSEYEDFPFPKDCADYPHHTTLLKYFQDYAHHFDVPKYIKFFSKVLKAERDETSGTWTLSIQDVETEECRQEYFDVLMVCNGHHWDPRMPEYPGMDDDFEGIVEHTHSFKHNRPYTGKRVLVIGGGNSACDVAVECSRVSSNVSLSMRRGHWFLPKFGMFGLPTDFISALFLDRFHIHPPKFLRQLSGEIYLRCMMGRPERMGLQSPTYGILEGHPTINSDLFYSLGHGKVQPKPGIVKFGPGKEVHFTDGTKGEFDVVLCGTGYKISFPFFDFLDWSSTTYVPLWKRIFHPTRQNLYFIGLFQPLGSIWPLADYQSQLVCQELLGHWQRPDDLAAEIDREESAAKRNFVPSYRHSTEVEYLEYRRELLSELQSCGIQARRKYAASPLFQRY
eukprot:Nitzschia sp. Nitz4//scaffold98_size77359//17747//19267//NITZ4_005541-RA/size77359-processed-gene-0.34-mRNA-1//-1//CDS//3329560736//8458//frame0